MRDSVAPVGAADDERLMVPPLKRWAIVGSPCRDKEGIKSGQPAASLFWGGVRFLGVPHLESPMGEVREPAYNGEHTRYEVFGRLAGTRTLASPIIVL